MKTNDAGERALTDDERLRIFRALDFGRASASAVVLGNCTRDGAGAEQYEWNTAARVGGPAHKI
jgi:hypothetical protein